MKKIMKTLALVAVAAMGLTACQNDIDEQIEVKDSVTVEFIADSADSRTSVDTSGEVPTFAWAETGETFAVLEQTSALAKATNVVYANDEGKAKITATFDTNSGQAEYKYVTVYPESGYDVESVSINEATLSLPAEQTMVEGSYDPAADLMVSMVVTTTAQPTEAQMVRFTRLAAVAKMSFRGFVDATEKVESVVFTAEGKNIAGTVTTDLANPEVLTTATGSNSVTVTAPEGGATEVYFTLLPTTIAASESYSVTVITDKKIYKKSGTIAEGKSLAFEAGMVTRFGVDLTDATVSDKWVLVRNVEDIEAGDIVTFVTKDLNWAMGKHGGSYHYASYTEIVKIGDYFFHPIPTAANDGNNRVQQLIVAPRSGKENAFDFYHGVDYTGDTYKGFLCTSSQNNLKLQDYPTNNSLFYIEIDAESGVASVVATDSENTANNLKYRAYNNGGTTSNRRFVCTNTITEGEHYDICIYKMAGAKGEVPTPDAVITVPDEDDQPVVIAKEGATDATFEGVSFPYVGDWTITATSDAEEWLTLTYEAGELTYTAAANEGSVRNTTVTITASHAGKDNIVKTFKVVQKGAPKNASIKDFSGYGVDENTEYLVTGVITTRVTSTTSNTVLSDVNDNTANFRYIDMADGSSFYNNAANTLGNVVSILASKSYSASYGGSSSAHSICQGYYNISASATKDFVEYGGGSVEITIEKTGTLQPGTINGSVDGNFAELTANGDKYVLTLKANDGAPRQVVATFTDGYDTTSVTVVQAADTSKGNTWELVTDASTLAAGDKVIIAAKDYDVAMSTSITSSKRSAVAVTKLGDKFITPVVGTQTFVLGAGAVEGTFVFYDDTNKGFLVSSNTSAELINQAYTDENTSFAISIEDGVATIANTAGDFSSNKLSYYYSSATSNYFCSSNSTSTTYKPLCLYRLVGVPGTIPVVPADVTTDDAVISDAVATEATAIPEVVFNYVGDWIITAASDAEWLTSLNYDKENNCLTYTAEANTDTARTATVTITASYAGQTDITWTFSLLQKGYTPEKTIAEYNAIPVAERNDSEYVRYKLTGRIENIESTSATSCKFTITDGTASVLVYGLETEDGSKDYGDFDLKVGDVVTLTAPRLTEVDTAGKGSNNPAYYLSHYNISATAVAAEYTAGSTATISVATTSGLDVTYEMEDCDFATISYSADSSQENTTAVVTFNSENTAEQARSVDVTFKTGMASTTITVTQKIDPAKVKGWVLVTDASELAVGDEVIIVAKNADVALGCFTSSSTSTANKNVSAVEIVGNSITSEEVETKKVQKFTLVEGYMSGTMALEFTYNDSTYYLYDNTGLKLYSNKNANGRSWTFEIEADGNAIITAQGTTKRVIGYNYKGSPASFSTYSLTAALATDTQADVCIYKNSEKE